MADTKTTALPWEEVARAIFAAKGITEGLWHVGVGLRFAGVTGDWADEERQTEPEGFPTAIVGITGVGLTPVSKPGKMVFDASAGSKRADRVPAAAPRQKKSVAKKSSA